MKIDRLKSGSTDQKLDQQIKFYINRSEVRLKDYMLDQKLDINQGLGQHVKICINISKVDSTD